MDFLLGKGYYGGAGCSSSSSWNLPHSAMKYKHSFVAYCSTMIRVAHSFVAYCSPMIVCVLFILYFLRRWQISASLCL